MFITEEQLKARLQSPNNVLNIVKKITPEKLTPLAISIPTAIHPTIPNNLPDENNRQRAARIARDSISQHAVHGEYTVNPNISNDVVRATIGSLSSQAGVSSQSIQKEFGVTRNQVTGARNSKKKTIAERIARGKDRVSELAIDRLMETLGLLTSDTLVEEKPKDLASIAASLAKVASSMGRDGSEDKKGSGVNITVYAPSPRELNSYSVIDV